MVTDDVVAIEQLVNRPRRSACLLSLDLFFRQRQFPLSLALGGLGTTPTCELVFTFA
jgi:hypothetical protein